LRYSSGILSLSALLLAASLTPVSALADSIVLKNGDHLTGTVTQLTGGKLTIHTDYAGDVTVTFDVVSTVKLDKPLVLPIPVPVVGKPKIKDVPETRNLTVTAIDRTDTGFVVTTATGSEQISPANVTALRTAAAEKAYEDSLHPSWAHAWTGGANISFALARGNSDTTTLGTGITAVRPTLHDKTSLYFNTLYTHDGIQNTTTANTLTSGARYDHNLRPKIFAFGTGDFATDALQELDLRTVVGGGLGWHAIASPRQQFDLLGGLVWTHENYGAVAPTDGNPAGDAPRADSFAALDFGEQYTRKIGAASAFTEQAYIFPDLQDTSQFRFTLNSGLTTKIRSFLSWQTNLTDVYVTNPPTGTKDNDLVLTTGLGFNFSRK
jgi:putative salt-induced outer membrane protein YdiY